MNRRKGDQRLPQEAYDAFQSYLEDELGYKDYESLGEVLNGDDAMVLVSPSDYPKFAIVLHRGMNGWFASDEQDTEAFSRACERYNQI